MFKKILLILVAMILLINISYSADIKTYQAAFNIVDNTIVVEVDALFNESETGIYSFELPADYDALSVYVDSKPVSPNVTGNLLEIELNKNSKIRFNYITEEFIDKTNFLMNMKLDFDVDNLVVKLVLPEGASLKKPIKESDLTSGSIYPKPTKATTDGRSLIFYWLVKDFKQGDEISVFTQIEPRRNISGLFVLFAGIILIITGIFFYIIKKKPKAKVRIAKPKARVIVRKEDLVEKHLKPDEEQIINVLKKREGRCEQGTLRVVTGFSKATLSRLLKELEDRKVIYKEKRGKKNLVFLKK